MSDKDFVHFLLGSVPRAHFSGTEIIKQRPNFCTQPEKRISWAIAGCQRAKESLNFVANTVNPFYFIYKMLK